MLRIPELVVDKYRATQAEALKEKQDALLNEVTIHAALKSQNDGAPARPSSSTAAPNPAGALPARTRATPDWAGEEPLNFRKRMAAAGTSISEFEGGNTCLDSVDALPPPPKKAPPKRLPV